MPGARERLEAVLARLEARAGHELVYTRLYPQTARAAADAADARQVAGAPLGPLDGLIVSIKDIFDVAGEPTLAGSVIRKGAEPAIQDAEIVKRLRRAGAVILGKTACNEFCFTSDGVNPHYGTPGNAADPARIPGGSSSGAGVAAGEATCDIAIGSDTGGSVRIPAALNGVVGFKPTASRTPLDGVFPLSPTLDSVGPLARSVQLCADADAVMTGLVPTPLTPTHLAGKRFAMPPISLLVETDDAIATAFEHALAALQDRGAVLVNCEIDDLLEAMDELTEPASIASIEAAQIHAGWLRAVRAGQSVNVDPRTTQTLLRRLDFPLPAFESILARRGELAAAMQARLSGVDALVLPTVPIFAPAIAQMADPQISDLVEYLLLRNTQVVNQFDMTAISLPLPNLPLPAGLSLVGRHGDDRNLLALAASVETLLAQAASSA